MYKVGFILNGRSRKKSHFYKELNQARQQLRNIEFNVVETSQSGHAVSLASEFIHDGYTHIIAVGGDGTLHEAVNGMMKNYSESIVLGLLPFGSANDFIKTMKSPRSIADLFESISEGKTTQIDLGKIEHDQGTSYFINIGDLGIGADVVKRVNASGRLFGANFTFFNAIVQTFLSYKNKAISCKADDWDYEGKINSLVLANGKYFGSGMCIAPDAVPNDGKFAVVISGNISIKDYLNNTKKIKKGQRVTHPEVSYKEATKVTISSSEMCGIEADGEFIGYAPATISIVPSKIRFLIA